MDSQREASHLSPNPHELKSDDLNYWYVVFYGLIGGVTAIINIFVACWLYKLIKKTAGNKVTVLSTFANEEHKEAFGSFVKNELQLDLKWVYSKAELKPKSKYVLLCKLENRLPEDVECILKYVGIEKEVYEYNILVVAMRKSDNGRQDTLSSSIGSETHRLHRLPVTTLFYYRHFTIHCFVNEKAKTDIKSFLS